LVVLPLVNREDYTLYPSLPLVITLIFFYDRFDPPMLIIIYRFWGSFICLFTWVWFGRPSLCFFAYFISI